MTGQADIAIIGAFAYDQIGTTGRPLDEKSLRNAKLQTLRRDFGGCGGNLAYSCARLNNSAFVFGTLGDADGAAYLDHLERLSIPTQGLLQLVGASAQGLVITDPNGDQFTAFYPGPDLSQETWSAHLSQHQSALTEARFVVQAPFPAQLTQAVFDLLGATNSQAQLIWCPGQYADMLSSEELSQMLPGVDLVVGNQWEIDYLRQHTSDIACLLLKTDGANPVQLIQHDQVLHSIPVPPAKTITDPTGCGDALIAAILCHLNQKQATLEATAIAAVLPDAITHAQRCLAVAGCQGF